VSSYDKGIVIEDIDAKVALDEIINYIKKIINPLYRKLNNVLTHVLLIFSQHY